MFCPSFIRSFIHYSVDPALAKLTWVSVRRPTWLSAPLRLSFVVSFSFGCPTNQWRRQLHVCVSYRLSILWFSEQTEPGDAAVVALSADRLRQSLRNPVSIVARLIDRPHHWSVTKYKWNRIIRRNWIDSAAEGILEERMSSRTVENGDYQLRLFKECSMQRIRTQL